MANLKDLAGLAALGAIGYKLAQGKDNTTAAAYPTGVMGGARTPVASDSMMDQGAGSVVPRPGQSTITGSQVNPDADTGDTSDYGNEGMRPVTPVAPSAKPKAKPKASGMTRAQNDALAKVNKAATDVRNPDYGNEGNRTVQPKPGSGSTMPAGARFVPGFGMVDADGNIIPRSREATSMPTTRNPRTGAQMLTFKKGGAVKKMAKGGMTSTASSASKRADGIASKGKTKCKMY